MDSDTQVIARHAIRIEQENHGLCKYSLLQQLGSLPESVVHGGLIFGSGLENAIDVIEAWGRCYPVFGNSAEVLRCVNNARQFFALLETLGISYPETRFNPPQSDDLNWLVKQQRSTGGTHIQHFYLGSHAVTPNSYFQRFIMGTPVSLLFLANGNDMIQVGFNTQWIISQSHLPFVYRGAVNRTRLSPGQRQEISDYAASLTTTLSLRGLNTLDCILTQNGVQVLELNPRPGATLSLYDGDQAEGLLELHIQACKGKLPAQKNLRTSSVRAHEIVYADRPVTIAENIVWPRWSADRPMSGTYIETGNPICTTQAEAVDAATVCRKLDCYKQQISSQLNQSMEAA